MAPNRWPNLSKYQKVGVALALLCASEDTSSSLHGLPNGSRNRDAGPRVPSGRLCLPPLEDTKTKETNKVICKDKKKKRRIWVKQCLKERKRLSPLNILHVLDSDDFHNHLGMDQDTFIQLLEMVRPLIEKKDTVMRKAVSAEERLLATLRFLATGGSYKHLRFSTETSFQLLSKIIPETCWAIYKVLNETIKMPSTEDEWRTAAKAFEEQWHFNNCVGVMDGKHILIQKPAKSGSLFYNYKGTFSVVLFAIVNANYEFIYVHRGSNGSMSGNEILENTKFHEKLVNNELMMPESYLLPGTDVTVPYVFLGDSAFGLDKNIMTPFPDKNISKEKRIFNYRLSRARRISENAFGILASRFRIFSKPINLKTENVDAVVLASCVLHNFLKKNSKIYWTPSSVDCEDVQSCTFRPGDWRQTSALTSLYRTNEGHTRDGNRIRNILTEYFNSAGKVSFQDKMVDVCVVSEQ